MSTNLRKPVKYILVTGGVLSGVGKGVIASSTGVILQSLGIRVTPIKIDPYINIDAGTMSPFEHGEVFVLDDGGEVDLDLGNYERFLGVTLSRDNNITTGKVYNQVIERERRGEYLGKTVQVIPHICDAIQEWVERVSMIPVDGSDETPDMCVIELGGTVGDIESMPFIEAMRQFQFRVGPENFCSIHVSLVPVVGAVGEQKTKPTQHSVREVRALGLTPDLVICRSSKPLTPDVKHKLSSFCHVPPDHVISVHDVSNIYRVPLLLEMQNLSKLLLTRLQLASPLSAKVPRLRNWTALAEKVEGLQSGTNPNAQQVRIAFVGKYTGLSDSYLSVIRALEHAAVYVGRRLVVDWIEATDLEGDPAALLAQSGGEDKERFDRAWALLKGSDGVLVPGGFGDRGVEGKILACRHARTTNKPYLGICLGMQIAAIEFARSVLGLERANSTEFDKVTPYPVVVFMPEISKTHMGGTMRLGKRLTKLQTKDCLSFYLYGSRLEVDERHRHRYEVNPEMAAQLEERGLRFVGHDESPELAQRRNEICELAGHDFFMGVQYHPEMKTRPEKPSPPFLGLLLAASGQLKTWLEEQKAKEIKSSH